MRLPFVIWHSRLVFLASAFGIGVAGPERLLGQGRAEQLLAHASIWGANDGFKGYAFLPVTIHGKAATVVIDLNCTQCDLELSDAALTTLGTSSTGPTESLTIGGMIVKDIPVQHNPTPAWSVSKPDSMPIVIGIAGVRFVQRFDLVYDFPHRRVHLYQIATQPADVRQAWLPPGFTPDDCGAMIDVPPGAGTFTGMKMQIDGTPVTGVIEMGPYVPKMNARAFQALRLPDTSSRVTITGRTPIYGDHILVARVKAVRMAVGTNMFGAWDSEVLQDVDVQELLPPRTPVMLMNLSMLRNVVLFNGMSSRQVCIARAAAAGPVPGRPAADPIADTLAFDTTHVVVTPADLAQLTTFLRATQREWSTPAMQALLSRHTVTYPLVLGDIGGAPLPSSLTPGTRITIPNYQLVADSVPTVAHGFTSAKLSPRRYMQLARSLNTAWITDQLDRLSHAGTAQGHDTTTVIGKNVAFIRANMADFTRLLQLALDVTTFQSTSQQPRDAMDNGMAPTTDLNP